MVVKIFVAPCTILSLVSGKTTGVHEARKTNSFRLQTGTKGKKWPSTKTTYKKNSDKTKRKNNMKWISAKKQKFRIIARLKTITEDRSRIFYSTSTKILKFY